MENGSIFIVTLFLVFSLTVVSTKKLIPILARRKIGQKILEIGPNWHKEKNGTPTMGGISFIFAIIISFTIILIINYGEVNKKDILSMINILSYGILNGIIGMIDDIAKIRKKQNEGLTPKGKLIFQSIAAIVFLIIMQRTVGISTILTIPFTNVSMDLGIVYYVVAFLVLCGITNAVNLTDGLDGLASTCVMIIGAFFSFVSLVKFESVSLSFFGGALLGVTLGFLIFNFYPAKIFMGDTGSLFLGGLIVAASFVFNNPMIVLIYGFVFICEALSVIAQVLYFKLTKGKRLFKMAPLHHHFEKCGYSEVKIVSIFGIFSVILCVLAYFGV